MKLGKSVGAMLGIMLVFSLLGGCQKEGPAEHAGKKIDHAVEQTSKKIEKIVERVDEKIEKTDEKIKEAVKNDKK